MIESYDIIVVIGCVGKIGSNIVNTFIKYGVKVIGVDVVSGSSSAVAQINRGNFMYVQRREDYERLLEEFDVNSAERGVGIINCAYIGLVNMVLFLNECLILTLVTRLTKLSNAFDLCMFAFKLSKPMFLSRLLIFLQSTVLLRRG